MSKEEIISQLSKWIKDIKEIHKDKVFEDVDVSYHMDMRECRAYESVIKLLQQ